MPYPSFSNRTEVGGRSNVTEREFDAVYFQLEEWLSKEHKSDGTHGAVTADSITLSGNATIGGSVTGDLTVAGNIVLSTFNTFLFGRNNALTNKHVIGIGVGDKVYVDSDGLGINMGLNAVFTVDGTAGSLAVNTNKFTVDGATGNVTLAGTLTATAAFVYTPATGALVIRGVNGSTTIFDVVDFAAVTEILKVEDNGRVSFGKVANLKNYTVATLPAGTRGDCACVTDALAPGFGGVLVGGGGIVTKAFFDGTNWIAE